MDWIHFEKIMEVKHIYKINNNSSKSLVLFGSCHMSTMGFMLNRLLDYKYNIYIILSWLFKKKGIEKFNMKEINDEIQKYVSSCDIFIYHRHIKDYEVYASKIDTFTNSNCFKFCIPNFKLKYTENINDYKKSLDILKSSISNSDFPEFNFIIERCKEIIFFNMPEHPTHYLLFLQSEAIMNKILNNGHTISIGNFHDPKNRFYFEDFFFVLLPGVIGITDEMNKNTNIKIDAEYYDVFLYNRYFDPLNGTLIYKSKIQI